MSVAIKRLQSTAPDFQARLDALLAFEAAQDDQIDRTVSAPMGSTFAK